MKYDFSDHLKQVLKKLSKRDVESYRTIKKKIEEIVASGNLDHYKPLRYEMKNQR